MESNYYPTFVTLNDFFEECRVLITEYQCPLCHGIYFNPVIDTCSHIYCENCFNISYGQNPICPISQIPLNSKPMKINLLLTILEKQKLYCPNKKIGCNWSGIYKDLPEHLNNICPKEKVKCNNANCPLSIIRETIEEHNMNCEYRTIECNDCLSKFFFKEFTIHENICAKHKIKCPQNCEVMILRETLEYHKINECPYTIIDCPYLKYGCNDKFYRKDLDIQMKENSSSHFLLFTKSFEALEEKCNIMSSQILSLTQNLHSTSTTAVPLRENNLPGCLDIISNIDVTSNKDIHFLTKRKRDPDAKEIISTPSKLTKAANNNNIKRDKERDFIVSVSSKSSTTTENINNNKNSLFDTINISKDIDVNGNKAKCITETTTEHRFLLGSKAIEINDKDCITSWSYTLHTSSFWIAFGVCNKDLVINNNLKFISSRKGFNHGCFLISSNGYAWNSNVTEENNQSIDAPDMERGNKIHFQYNPANQELRYQLNGFSGVLSHVYPNKGSRLVLCVLFLHPEDEIEVNNYNSFYHINK